MKRSLFYVSIIFLFISCGDDSAIEPQPDLPVVVKCPSVNFLIEKEYDTNIFGTEYLGCDEISVSLTISLRGGSIDKLSQIETVGGDLKLTNNKETANLLALNNLKRIEGDLIISGNETGTIIEFTNLEFVGGDIVITENHKIVSLECFPNLTFLGGNLTIVDNRSLTHLNIIKKLKEFNGDILIQNNSQLTEVKGFYGESGSIIKGDVSFIRNEGLKAFDAFDNIDVIEGRFILKENYQLESFAGFSAVRRISSIEVESNNLISMEGFEKLGEVEGKVQIFGTSLETAPKFESLTRIGGWVFLRSNSLKSLEFFVALEDLGGGSIETGTSDFDDFSSLNSLKVCHEAFGISGSFKRLSGFRNVNYLGSFSLSVGASELTDLDGFNNLIEIDGDLNIIGVPKLKTITGFKSLSTINGQLRIDSNEELVQLEGFDNLNRSNNILIRLNESLTEICGINSLQTIEEEFSIRDNRNLISICGFNGSTSIKHLDIYNNPKLQRISGFMALESIGGNLHIGARSLSVMNGFKNLERIEVMMFISSNFLLDFTAFSKLTYVGELVEIAYCERLGSLHGLEKLTSPLKNLVIKDNSALSDISGINNIASITEYIEIKRNLNLSDCAIDLICNRLETNEVNIGTNGDKCSDINQISSFCK